ncbi:DnaB-like helicase C-terminal domain-containing protein [Candidatus Dojkabacteria bacterium]|uniref:DnaB-like helicase C-terminal domain-containing protein n=1 Tax=Candidatus Dojkabacteria bacterium TaxID=2099670 RepID=A0A955L841_9BACT|nr:DnaB-like helicase C-terminal domain-containing protein [Candidatus Dojkabacteria bacterium]
MDQDVLTKLDEIKALDAKNEKIAIGHMLQDEVAAITGTKMLIAKYFITPHAVHVFEIVKSYVEEGKSVSDIYFHIHSIAEDDWQSFSHGVSRDEYLRQCMVMSVPFLGTDVYAEGVFNQIQKQYFRREAFFLYKNAKPKILNTADNKDLTEIVTDISQRCNALLDGMTPSDEHDYEAEVMQVLNSTEQAVISSGFKDLDQIIDGFRPGQLITVGAGTGVGKSAFAVNLALNITDQGYKVGLWSFEMDESEVYQRIISNITEISRKDKSQAEERYNAVKKYLKDTKHNIQIFTDRIKDLGSFYLQCRKCSIKENMKVIIIDYVQLIHLSGFTGSNRVAEIELITKTLKNMASELGITIIILSQLSREYQKRENKQPILSDLRDSGSIEQDSNVVLFLHRQDDYPLALKESEKMITVIIAKNRDGRSGAFVLKYQGNITKFKEE